jgi:hypothetical protein
MTGRRSAPRSRRPRATTSRRRSRLRAPLLLAVVASYRKSEKVPRWEQEAVASGVAHVLSLLLDEAGWGVIWRTGHYTRAKAVAKAHGLTKDEELLGWLYVGGKPSGARPGRRKSVDPRAHLSRMPASAKAADKDGGRRRPARRKTRRRADGPGGRQCRRRRQGARATMTELAATTTINSSVPQPGPASAGHGVEGERGGELADHDAEAEQQHAGVGDERRRQEDVDHPDHAAEVEPRLGRQCAARRRRRRERWPRRRGPPFHRRS